VWDKVKKQPPSPGAYGAAAALNGPALSAAEASVRQLIANGKSKAALDAAKEVHKTHGTVASEALLVDAYAARIESLVDQNLHVEAKALLDLVRERYPSARQRLSERTGTIGTQAARLEELLRPLTDPELSADRRAAIDAAIMREVDLAALAGCAALPSEHPLRTAARALHGAFQAATSGPVDEAAVELPEISHRSPLAPWKLLVRAIACFYRSDDEACRRYLGAIKPESAPARLVPAMQAMLSGKAAGLTPAAAALASYTISNPAAARKALETLDRTFQSGKAGAILKAVREVGAACRDLAPDQVAKLKPYIVVRGMLAGVQSTQIQAALGGTISRDARFLRLYARGEEAMGDPESIAMACAAWDDFRQQAVREGWFKANGPEAALLYLHMAEQLRRIPRELLAELQRTSYREGRRPGEDLYFLDPDKLYARACALDPHRESFLEWMEWAKGGRKGAAEEVAEAWHKILRTDIEPILFLMEQKEKRNAFPSALQYLAKAELIDSVNPAVRRARLRLLSGAALRHLQQKKPHLAEERIAEIAALPQAQQGDRPAFLAALRYMTAVSRGAVEAAGHRAEVERLLGGKAAAALLIYGVADACKRGNLEQPPAIETFDKSERAALPAALVRVIELAKEVRLPEPVVPNGWVMEAGAQFSRGSQSLSVGQLETLAAMAVSGNWDELAYAITGAGLQRGGLSEANFLFLRALSLPYAERRAVCMAAAVQLARETRHMAIVDRAVEELANSPYDDLKFTAEQAATVVRKEKEDRRVPTAGHPGPDYGDLLGDAACDCPKCRAARGEELSPIEEFDEDDGDLDLEAILNEMPPPPPGMPPEVAAIMFTEALEAARNGEPLDSVMQRLFGKPRGKSKKGKRR
jgi:hypothetical protein